MSNKQFNVLLRHAVIWCFTGWITLLLASCGNPQGSNRQLTPAEQIWMKAENEYRTNAPPTAYKQMLAARDSLLQMKKSGQGGLEYTYCLAILDGRLFLLARNLGDTNAAEQHLKESAFYFNENRGKLRMPETNFTADAIEAIIQRRDEKVHSVSPIASSNAANSTLK